MIQHISSKHRRPFPREHRLQHVWEELVRFSIVDTPDDAILAKGIEIFGREVRGDIRRIRPVEQPGR